MHLSYNTFLLFYHAFISIFYFFLIIAFQNKISKFYAIIEFRTYLILYEHQTILKYRA